MPLPTQEQALPGTNVPSGAQISPAGATGAVGTPGVNAYTLTTTASFVVPAIGSTVVVNVANANWLSVGQMVSVAGAAGANAGDFQVTAISGNQLTLLVLNPTPIPLASATQSGLLAQVSGASTDYVGGDNATHALPTGATSTNIQVFSTPGAFTWTKPAGAVWVEIICIGGGGGGGSGAYVSSATAGGGGGGGAGGGYSDVKYPASALSSSVTGNVGVGGTGGASQTTAGNGIAGVAGGNSNFGPFDSPAGFHYYCTAAGGGNGTQGMSAGTAGAGGAAGSSSQVCGGDGAAGGASGAAGVSANMTNTPQAAGNAVTSTVAGGGGGGGGGGLAAASQASLAGGGGAVGPVAIFNGMNLGAGGTTPSGSGTAGNTVGAGFYQCGGGGGGGASTITTTKGAGATGGLYGGGGGGGGAAQSPTSGGSGAGGNGANGVVVVTTYF